MLTTSIPGHALTPIQVWTGCGLRTNPRRHSDDIWSDSVSAVCLALAHYGGSAPFWLIAAWLLREGYAATELDADRLIQRALYEGRGYLSVYRLSALRSAP